MKQDKIWDYFQTDGSASFDASYLRLHFLAKKCKKNQRVLNIGVGGGVFERIALCRNIDVYSLDPSEKSIETLISTVTSSEKSSNFKVGYSNNIPFPENYFDVVVMSEVLEHLDDTILMSTIKEVYRVLKIGGRFMGTVPNDENLEEAVVICPECGVKFHRWGHVQNFNAISLTALLNNSFQNIAIRKKGFLSREKLNFKTWIYSRLNDILYKLDMRRAYAILFFECKKTQ